MAVFNLPELMHAHPLATVMVMTALVFGVFLWALFAGSQTRQQVEDIQTGGDWAWPSKDEKEAA